MVAGALHVPHGMTYRLDFVECRFSSLDTTLYGPLYNVDNLSGLSKCVVSRCPSSTYESIGNVVSFSFELFVTCFSLARRWLSCAIAIIRV